MKIHNDIETAVGEEVRRQKTRGRGEHAACWCSLCEADVTALAMTFLPPRYCTTNCQEHQMEKERPGAVKNAVLTSMRKVSQRPKHRFSAPEISPSKVRVVNYTYEEGMTQVGTVMLKSSAPCPCEKCRSDILAYALNRYPAKYGVLHGGTSSLPDYQLDFIRHELSLILCHAAGVVGSHPRHPSAVTN